MMVKNGVFDGRQIEIRHGIPKIKGYTAIAISEQQVTWSCDGEQIQWNRTNSSDAQSGSLEQDVTGGYSQLSDRLMERESRLSRRERIMTLCHATSETNAERICRLKTVLPGSNGFLGPGFYFSENSSNARRWCQCRTGSGPIVVLRCQVNMGHMQCVGRGWYTLAHLLDEGIDSLKEEGRDCYMLPNNDSQQICMQSIKIEYL